MADAEGAKVVLDVPTLEYTLRMRLERIAEGLRADPSSLYLLRGLDAAVGLARSLPLEVNLWKIQNICYELRETAYRDFRQKVEQGDEDAREWIDHFRALAEKLSLHVG
jgi:hypothetical protein